MDTTTLSSVRLLLLFCSIGRTFALPTLGHIDRNRLETYEEFSGESEDVDLFGNLTFRFSCQDKRVGLYADPDYNCRIFHICDDSGDGFPVICPSGTSFDQKQRICTDLENVDCNSSHEWYHVNEMSYSDEEYKDQDEEEVPAVMPLSLS